MSRQTNFYGLKEEAEAFVNTLKNINSGHYTRGMFDEEVSLESWQDEKGNIYREVEQCSPWSSGPLYFYMYRKSI